MCSPKCCCRKKSRITKPFNCLIILFSITGVSIIFFFFVIAFLKSSEKGLHGTLCTLSMLTYDIVQGVGLLKKTEFDKPHWYGLIAIDNLVAATNIMLTSLTPNCTNFLSHMKAPFGTGSGTNDPNYTNILIDFPDKIVQVYSNVMSPSALNTITEQKNLAKTSKTPGRTQMINLFECADGYRIVDLPGYGYAKVPLEMKKKIRHITSSRFMWFIIK